MQLGLNFIHLFVESAPYLLLGMWVAGLINQFVPKTWIDKSLGQDSSVVTAALIGAPLPLCSCSVIPVAMGIRRSGASKASTASFLVATPETGVDSLGITYALMGPIMTIARPIAAIFSAITTGMLIKNFGTQEAQNIHQQKSEPAKKSCCGHAKPKPESFGQKLKSSFVFGFGQLLRDFMLWFLIGIGFAALVATYVPTNYITDYAQGIGAMLLVVLISIPMYICATASTPIAVALLMSGITPGAALVFMLTGPATNIATLMVIKKELGKRELGIYLVGIIVSALFAGLLLDYLFGQFNWQLDLSHGQHSDMIGLFYQTCAWILAGLILIQFLKNYGFKKHANSN
ncbi:SO_0444 family Cu/Zn efflux transporter [Paraglaciecola aquimarina]|uniref:SO_0444 family Cu/Zn efflux transporter n=1 Tax=Paraglaciecola algarum TaxID=3050085 RepID=A0ABS9D517_9ALTE|nr:SO_0444 family Cu/Zn efflux transporter [Paraglaciecola sp. G1-23]MCF2947537.1 SO_0444 family Cu/Zn efflux transporter [Paraglaciecola sp. G1-23]